MNEVLIPLLSALLGAVIGSLTAIASVVVQTTAMRRRDRTRLAMEAAIEEHKRAVELAGQRRGPSAIVPLSCYVYYHANLLSLLDEGRLSPESLRELDRKQKEFMRVIEEKGTL